MCGRCCADCGAGSVSFPRDGETDRTWAIYAGAVWKYVPQSGREWRKDLSALAPNTQHAEMRDFRQMLILNFHCNLDFGTQRGDSGKRINNEDKENGILSGAK